MHRLALSLLWVALVAVVSVLTAAPAPFAKSFQPWITGWDKPVDPVGDCTFTRKGDKLTIAAPARNVCPKGPKLLRPVEGDFVVQVRIASRFRPVGKGVFDVATCLFITDGSTRVIVARAAQPAGSFHVVVEEKDGNWPVWKISEKIPVREIVVLRLERRGDKVTAAFSDEGDKLQVELVEVKLAEKLKVGVSIGSVSQETFQATFDQFKLTPIKPGK